MAEFASEAGVRLQVQVDDTAVASAELVAACIAEAHERVLADLDDAVDVESPPAGSWCRARPCWRARCGCGRWRRGTRWTRWRCRSAGSGWTRGQKFAALMSMARRFEKAAAVLLGALWGVAGGDEPGGGLGNHAGFGRLTVDNGPLTA